MTSKTCSATLSARTTATSLPRPPRGAVAPLGRGAGGSLTAVLPRPRALRAIAFLTTALAVVALTALALPALVLIDAIAHQGGSR